MADSSEVISSMDCSNEEKYDDKKAQVTERLQQREHDRLAHLQKRKDIKEINNATDESVEFFKDHFSVPKTEIINMLKNVPSIEKDQLPIYFDNMSAMLQKLQKFLSDSTMFLPQRELLKSQEIVTQLQSDIHDERDKAIPKKRFAFKSKKKLNKDPGETVKPLAKHKVTVEVNDCNFTDRTSESLVKKESDINGVDVALARLSDCTVHLLGSPSAIHINSLTRCVVICGPVSGSVIMEACSDCTIVLACQQLRIHHTTSTNFYIHVTSKAIIEDCHDVKFAPYELTYPNIDQHYILSCLDKGTNNWNSIDDFNWLASNTPSPNWGIIADAEHKQWVV